MVRSRLFEQALREHDDDVDVRAGCIIRKKGTDLVLGCRGWGKKKGDGDDWLPNTLDLAKGHLTKGESLEDGARREVKEETGISLGKLRKLGDFAYGSKRKRLVVFYAEADFDVNALTCKSMFTNVFGQTVPEMVGYHLVDIGDLEPWFKSLKPIMQRCFDEM